MLKAKLVIVGAKAKTTEVKLRLPSTIGRGREATVTVKHPLVSRLHCKLTELNGELVVRDLGSLNGTFISNEQLEANEDYILPPDELLTVGGVTFRAVYELPAEANTDSTQMNKAISADMVEDIAEVDDQSQIEASAPAPVAAPASADHETDLEVNFEEVDEPAALNEPTPDLPDGVEVVEEEEDPAATLPPGAGGEKKEGRNEDVIDTLHVDQETGETFSDFLKGLK